jgi:hypothetical protein
MPPFGESIGELSILDFQQSLPESRGARTIMRQVYRLEPTRTGTITIEPISVGYVDNRPGRGGVSRVIETDPLTLTITSLLAAEAPSLKDLKPAAGPVALNRSYRWIGWSLLAGLVLIGAVVSSVVWWRRPRPVAEAVLSPQQEAQQRLDQLLRGGLAQRDVKEFYVRLTGILRCFIERTHGIHAPEQTTEEFLREAASTGSFTIDERQRLQNFLESADLVKYAAHLPRSEDIEASIDRARAFMGLVPTEIAA